MKNTRFKPQDAAELYGVPYWSSGYFRVNDDGKLEVDLPGTSIVLEEVIEELVARGKSMPIILRFPQVLAERVKSLSEAFKKAIKEYDYQGKYQGVFPIKVNQRRVVVETIARAGYSYHTGLEAGSKAELPSVWPRTSTRRPCSAATASKTTVLSAWPCGAASSAKTW